MNNSVKSLITLVVSFCVSLATLFAQSNKVSGPSKVKFEMEEAFGVYPKFMENFPAHLQESAWEELKALSSPNAALEAKYSELVALGVASQVPCDYCVYYHTEMAKLLGASEAEIGEAVASAAFTRRWSTVLNGSNMPLSNFQKELDKMIGYMQNQETASIAQTPGNVQSEMEAAFGTFPKFIQLLPEHMQASAWETMKARQNPNAALPAKYSELIQLGVAAQIPCNYCVYYHTEMSKMLGASDEERKESIASAANTRHWSTAINGSQLSFEEFKKDIDNMVENIKNTAKK